MTNEDYVRYWMKGAEENFASMKRVFDTGEYVWALFIGHLVIEKLLKACCARRLGADVPKIHDLTRLAKKAGIALSTEREDDLDRLTLLQTNVRYDNRRGVPTRRAQRTWAQGHIESITELRKWLLGILSK